MNSKFLHAGLAIFFLVPPILAQVFFQLYSRAHAEAWSSPSVRGSVSPQFFLDLTCVCAAAACITFLVTAVLAFRTRHILWIVTAVLSFPLRHYCKTLIRTMVSADKSHRFSLGDAYGSPMGDG